MDCPFALWRYITQEKLLVVLYFAMYSPKYPIKEVFHKQQVPAFC